MPARAERGLPVVGCTGVRFASGSGLYRHGAAPGSGLHRGRGCTEVVCTGVRFAPGRGCTGIVCTGIQSAPGTGRDPGVHRSCSAQRVPVLNRATTGPPQNGPGVPTTPRGSSSTRDRPRGHPSICQRTLVCVGVTAADVTGGNPGDPFHQPGDKGTLEAPCAITPGDTGDPGDSPLPSQLGSQSY